MSLFHAGLQPALDANGNPISGATWTFYLYGTLTPTLVYSDEDLTTSLGSSETADAAGRFVVIYINDDIPTRAILRDAGGTTIKDIGLLSGALSGSVQGIVTVAPSGTNDDGTPISDAFVDLVGDFDGGIVQLQPVQEYLFTDIPAYPGSALRHDSARCYIPNGCTLRGNGAILTGATAQGEAVVMAQAVKIDDYAVSGATVATVTADTDSTTTVTITSVNTGTVQVGLAIAGSGIPAGATIASFGTFNGTSGTVVISAAATATASGVALTLSGMLAGVKVFQLATVADALDFVVGEQVLIHLKDNPADLPEPMIWGWAKVTAVDTGAGTVTLDRALPEAWDGTGTNNTHLRRGAPASGLIAENMTFSAPSLTTNDNLVYGMRCYGGVNVQVDNLRGINAGAGTIVCQYVEGLNIGYIEAHSNPRIDHGSYGRGISLGLVRGRVDHLEVSNCGRYAAFIEHASEVSIGYLHDIVMNDSTVTRHKGVIATYGSRVHVDRALFEGKGEFYTHESVVIGDGRVSFGTCRVVTSGNPFAVAVPAYDCERLELCINGVEELYLAAKARWVEQTIWLTDGMSESHDFAPGCVAACLILFGGGAVAADFLTFTVGKVTHATNVLAAVPASSTTTEQNFICAYNFQTFAAGQTRPLFGSVNGLIWTHRAEVNRVNFTTAVGPGLAGSGKYIRVRMLITPNELAALDDVASDQIAREQTDFVYEGSKTFDWADLATATQQTTTVTVTGAALGDLVVGVSMNVDLAGTELRGYVNATDTVTVYHRNDTGGNVNLASGTLTAQVRKRRLIA